MAKKTSKKKRTRKQKIAWYNREINFNIKAWFLILLVSIPVLLIVTQPGLWTFGQKPDDDETGDDSGGDTGTEPELFSDNDYIYDKDGYYLSINTKSKTNRSTISIYIKDKELDDSKNYIYLNGSLYNETDHIDYLDKGVINNFTIDNNETDIENYDIFLEFFDTINGDNVIVSNNIVNLTMMEGNLSDYIQTVPQRINTTNSNTTLLDEYEPFDETIMLYHFNESYGEPLDSSFNGYDSVRVGILPDNMHGATGKFMTDAYLFNRGLLQGIDVDSQYNFTNEISIDCWINKNSFGNVNYNESIFSRNDSSIFAGFRYQSSGKLKYLHFHLVDELDNEYILEYEYDFLLGTYYHVAFTYDNDTMRLFLNNDIVASSQIGSIDIKNSTEENYTIGYRNNTNYYNGILEELRIENHNNTQFEQNLLKNLYYNDSIDLEFNTTNGYLEFIGEFDASYISNETSNLDVEVYYLNDNDSVNITSEKLYAYNYGNDSFVEFDYFPNLIPSSDYISGTNEIMIMLNYTANVSTFYLDFDYFIINGYYDENETYLDWSYLQDDTRIVMFQNETTQNVTFQVEFEINDPMEEIFDSITYYEATFSEGNYTDNVDFCVMVYNYTSNDWINVCIYIDYTITDENEILFELKDIPYYYYDDIIENNTHKQTIGIRFDFASESAKVYLDYIQKVVYYMDTTDITEVFHGFKIEYNPV